MEPVLAPVPVKLTSPLVETEPEVTEAKVAAPAPVTFQSLSCSIKFVPEDAPMVVVALPEVLTFAVPVSEVVPEVTVKLLPEATVVLPLSETPPLPLCTVVVDVPLVEPRVVVWLDAEVPRLRF